MEFNKPLEGHQNRQFHLLRWRRVANHIVSDELFTSRLFILYLGYLLFLFILNLPFRFLYFSWLQKRFNIKLVMKQEKIKHNFCRLYSLSYLSPTFSPCIKVLFSCVYYPNQFACCLCFQNTSQSYWRHCLYTDPRSTANFKIHYRRGSVVIVFSYLRFFKPSA